MGEICRSVIKDMGFGLELGIGIGYPTGRLLLFHLGNGVLIMFL